MLYQEKIQVNRRKDINNLKEFINYISPMD